MPAEVLSYFLNHKDVRLRLKFQLVLQCAPLLKRKKVSCGITVEDTLYGELGRILRGTRITYRRLYGAGGRSFVLFYREKELEEYIRRVGIRSFIQSFGYEDMELDEMLERLSQRACMTSLQVGFPHEIGAFLGYPVEDVKGFIENEGRGCLLPGYWKVYSNPVMANQVFRGFDQAKACAVNEFLTGKSIQEICVG